MRSTARLSWLQSSSFGDTLPVTYASLNGDAHHQQNNKFHPPHSVRVRKHSMYSTGNGGKLFGLRLVFFTDCNKLSQWMGKWSPRYIQQPEGFCRKKQKCVLTVVWHHFPIPFGCSLADGRTDTHYVASSRKPHSYRYYYPTTKVHPERSCVSSRVVLRQLIESTTKSEAPNLLLLLLLLLNCLEKYSNLM